MKAINKDKAPFTKDANGPPRSIRAIFSFVLSFLFRPERRLGTLFPSSEPWRKRAARKQRKTGPRMLNVHPSLPCAQREKRYVANVDDHVHSLIKLASHAPTGQALTLPHT